MPYKDDDEAFWGCIVFMASIVVTLIAFIIAIYLIKEGYFK